MLGHRGHGGSGGDGILFRVDPWMWPGLGAGRSVSGPTRGELTLVVPRPVVLRLQGDYWRERQKCEQAGASDTLSHAFLQIIPYC